MLIAGPTASGKSRAALDLAEEALRRGRNPLIVNADSMQVYDALAILTARPDAAAMRQVPHQLYGHLPAEKRYSVAAWLQEASAAIVAAEAGGGLPILVGGTGLYFKALTEGLADLPPIPPDVREELTRRLERDGLAFLYARLAAGDPVGAGAIRPSDPQRTLRALEVLEATGVPLSEWQARRSGPLLSAADTLRFVLEADRPELHRRIESRLDEMVQRGAMDEVEALLARRLPPDLPVMKAIGVGAFSAAMRGEITTTEALARAVVETRRYAKRQSTWFRNQMPGWLRVPA